MISTLGSDCLWVTFADGHLWWAFADPEVAWLGQDEDDRGARMRRTLDGWRRVNLKGQPLRVESLSTRLTQVAAYRQTICRVKAPDYLLRRINGVEEPVVRQAREARSAMRAVAAEMIAGLHWSDFETLVDLIFARSGWQRVSRVGENLTDVDLVGKHTKGDRNGVKAERPNIRVLNRGEFEILFSMEEVVQRLFDLELGEASVEQRPESSTRDTPSPIRRDRIRC